MEHEKHTHRDCNEIQSLINRLNRIEGQIRGIKNMVENSSYCIDIITQVSAASAALNSLNKEILNRHLHTCVVRDIQNGDMTSVDELADLFKKVMK